LNRQQEELNSQRIAALLNTQELEIARTSLDAQQEERHRIAKQLHDSIGGNLAGIKLQLANIEGNTKFQKNVINQVNDTYELVRDISHDLVPKKFNQNAFTFLIENYIEQLQENSKLEIAFSAHPKAEINNLSEKLKVELYQITQELFTNTIKHANTLKST
jgi:signal transduction histidine kinase